MLRPSSPTVREAATVIVMRDAPGGGLEVLMLRRTSDAVFVGGAYVFPGGAVDPADRDPVASRLYRGRTDSTASAVLGVDRGGLAFWIAAVRECFEESGVLLAVHPDGAPLSLVDPDAAARFAEYRHALNRGDGSLVALCLRESLQLDVGNIHYFGHWITPEGAPRRYDTRFFVAAAPPGQVPGHDEVETVASLWVRPSEALERFEAGEFELITPTIKSLEAMSEFPDSASLLAAAARIGETPTAVPRLGDDGAGVRIPLPGDPGYEEVLARGDRGSRRTRGPAK